MRLHMDRSVKFAEFFDFRNPGSEPFLVHLCALARPYGAALDGGELTLQVEEGIPRVTHYEHSWPLAPASWGKLLSPAWHQRPPTAAFMKWNGCDASPTRVTATGQSISAPHSRRSASLKTPMKQESFGAQSIGCKTISALFDAVMQRQFYMLHDWRLSGELTNYRRFFDIDALIGIRAELPSVMAATHARIERMVLNGEIDGVRVDHPDGLRDPLAYFRRLRELLPEGRIYIEKILENDERLNEEWPIEGTVGYDFLSKVNRLWMDDQRIDALTATYSDFTGHSVNFAKPGAGKETCDCGVDIFRRTSAVGGRGAADCAR